MKRRGGQWWMIAAVLFLGAGAATVCLWWRHGEQVRQIVAASIPARPSLRGLPAELLERVSLWEHRARVGPDRVAALAALSRLYHANGFFEEASLCYRGLLQVDPANPRWPHRLASILAGYGQLHEALPLLRRTVELAPDYLPAQIRYGDALLKTDQGAAAAKVYTAVLARDPDNPYALLGLARLDIAAGRWDAARQRLEPVVARTNYMLGYDLLPTVYEHLGEPARAAAIRARAKASGAFSAMPDPWVDDLVNDCYNTYEISLAAGTARFRGDPATAIRLLERAISLAPDSGPLQFEIASVYLEQHDYAQARRHLERCVALTPNFADGWFFLVTIANTLGDRAAADRFLAEGLVHCPQSPSLHLERARDLSAAGRYDLAIPEFQESIRLRPDDAEAYVDLARVYFQLDRLQEGVTEIKRALAAEPENPAALSTLALYTINTGDAAAARALLQRVRQQVRTKPEVAAALVRAFQKRFGEAP